MQREYLIQGIITSGDEDDGMKRVKGQTVRSRSGCRVQGPDLVRGVVSVLFLFRFQTRSPPQLDFIGMPKATRCNFSASPPQDTKLSSIILTLLILIIYVIGQVLRDSA